MKPVLMLVLMAALLSGCREDQVEIIWVEDGQCEAALAESRRPKSRSDFLAGCASAPWVAVCEDGSASFSDDFNSVCANGGGVATWHRVIDG